jgi:hypothetical protein
MAKFRQVILGTTVAAAIACVPLAPAVAGPYSYGHPFGWGAGRGLFGAVIALATLPLAIASAVVSSGASAVQSSPPAYGPGGYGGYGGYDYAPRVAYPAPVYYAPRPAFYPGAVYPGRAYPATRPSYAPHPVYPGRGYYHAGGYAYPHR